MNASDIIGCILFTIIFVACAIYEYNRYDDE